MKELIIATKNRGKVKDFKNLFNKYGIVVKSLFDLNQEIPDVEETGLTFEENARLKAETISVFLNAVVLADDSGLVVDELDGSPGVYSARFAGEPKDDKRNNEKLLDILAESHNRTARFVCVLACAIPGQETIFAKGKCEGQISKNLAGKEGFGYDPLFIPEGYHVTMAELSSTQKNEISHRYHALTKLETVLQEKNII